MGDAEVKINGDGMKCTMDVSGLKSETNGFEFPNCNDIAKDSSVATEGIRTYKRRRRARSSWDSRSQEDYGADVESSSQLVDQLIKEPVGTALQNNSCEQAHLRVNSSDACSEGQWKNSILGSMYQSLADDEGGVQVCIRQALENVRASVRASDHTTRVKESRNEGEDKHQCCFPKPSLLSGPQNVANGHAGATSNGFSNKSNHHTVTAMCQQAFFNVLVSEKFASLCKLLLENFEGIKADHIFYLSLVNSRMKKGDYEHSPLLFSTDMQQVWRKLQGIGADLVSLAKSLSNMSRSSYNEQVGGLVRDAIGEQNEVGMLESDSHTKMEQAEDCHVHTICTCRNCGGKADGRDCLVCDSCEEMYHVSCIEPALKEIPLKSWYCASCTATGVRSSHDNCSVCEKLNVSKTVVDGVGGESVSADEATADEMWGNSNCSTDNGALLSEESIDINICKVCGNEVNNGDKLRECGHKYCPKKHYHEGCLTTKQLKSYSRVWYCYSCLCRRCLTDEEDDQIVLCDGCDHAYHLYCMEPQLTSIPAGKWYCRKCDAALKAIRMAKLSYETNNQKQTRKSGGSRKLKGKTDKTESEQSRGGMEALLCAVNTLNNEED